MKTRQAGSNSVLKGAVIILALSFLMMATTEAGASIVVRAKAGPVSVRIGNAGLTHGHGGPAHVYRVSRNRRGSGAIVMIEQPCRCRRDVVWVPGHFVTKRHGHRKWVRGHWRGI